jgi:predicted transcriptional regulator
MATYTIKRNVYCSPLHSKYNTCGFPLQRKYRSHFEIIALMLEAVKESSQARFSIMKHASINCAQLKKFINTLIETGFMAIDVREGKVRYRATEKGLAFLNQYYVLLGMLLTPQADTRPPTVMYELEVRHT